MSNDKMYSKSDSDSDSDVVEEEVMPLIMENIYTGLVMAKDYVLLNKIGHGNNASVWMTFRISTKSYHAIKVQDYQCYHDGCREVAVIRKINQYCLEHIGEEIYCVKMLDYFIFAEDEKTKYVCSVYDLFAGSLQMLINDGKYKYGLPIPVVKRITKQLLISLTVMHQKLEIIHTDIKPENILFHGIPEYQIQIMELFNASRFVEKYQALCQDCGTNSEKFEQELEFLALESVKDLFVFNVMLDNDEEFIPDDEDFDENEIIEGEDDSDEYDESDSGTEAEEENTCNDRTQSVDDIIEHLDYKDIHNLEQECDYDFDSVLNNRANSKDFEKKIDDLYVLNCKIAVTDFGNSYFYSGRTKNEIQDRRYRSPEVLLDLNYKYSCDIWSVACVVFELLTGFVLFEPLDEPLNKDIHHLFLMEKTLGPIPMAMKKASKRKRFLFDKDRQFHIKNVDKFNQFPLKDRLIKQYLFSEEEADQINDFLLAALRYNPMKRLTAQQLLEHPWLNRV